MKANRTAGEKPVRWRVWTTRRRRHVAHTPHRTTTTTKEVVPFSVDKNKGCDVYIEATGNPESVPQGLHMIRRLGTFVEFSVFSDPVTVDWTIIGATKELNIHGSHLGPYCYPLAMDMLAKGQVPADDIVTHAFALEQFAEAFQLVHNPTESIKVMLTP